MRNNPAYQITQTATLQNRKSDSEDRFVLGTPGPSPPREMGGDWIKNSGWYPQSTESGAIVQNIRIGRVQRTLILGVTQSSRDVTASDAHIDPIREYPCPIEEGNYQCRLAAKMHWRECATLVWWNYQWISHFGVTPPRAMPGVDGAQFKAASRPMITCDVRVSRMAKSRIQIQEDGADFTWWPAPNEHRIAPADVEPSEVLLGAAIPISTEESDQIVAAEGRLKSFCGHTAWNALGGLLHSFRSRVQILVLERD